MGRSDLTFLIRTQQSYNPRVGGEDKADLPVSFSKERWARANDSKLCLENASKPKGEHIYYGYAKA